MSDKEIWKPIPEHDGYEVSNFGNVRSYRRQRGGEFHKAPHAIKPAIVGGPYRFVNIMGKDKLPHVLKVGALVLAAFVGQRPSKHCMCHKDDNPINDTLDNLYWGTAKQNGFDRIRNNISKGIGRSGYMATINKKQRILLRAHIAKRCIELYQSEENQKLSKYECDYISLSKLAKITGKNPSSISLIVNGKRSVKLLQFAATTQPVAAA